MQGARGLVGDRIRVFAIRVYAPWRKTSLKRHEGQRRTRVMLSCSIPARLPYRSWKCMSARTRASVTHRKE